MNFNVQVLAARDSRGNTALHLAAIGNYIDTALFLVWRLFESKIAAQFRKKHCHIVAKIFVGWGRLRARATKPAAPDCSRGRSDQRPWQSSGCARWSERYELSQLRATRFVFHVLKESNVLICSRQIEEASLSCHPYASARSYLIPVQVDARHKQRSEWVSCACLSVGDQMMVQVCCVWTKSELCWIWRVRTTILPHSSFNRHLTCVQIRHPACN